jgi:TRAP-type C4-dicarboxylate transport system permease small subunit
LLQALASADRILRGIERWLVRLAAVLTIIIMLIIVCDVVLRYFFRSPLPWATESIGWYLMVAVFYGALSGAFSRQSHVRVDILRNLAPPGFQRLLEIVTCLVAALVFGMIPIITAQRAWDSWLQSEVMSGVIEWPTWPPPAFVALGTTIITARLLLNAIAFSFGAMGNPDVIALPSASGSHGPQDFSE